MTISEKELEDYIFQALLDKDDDLLDYRGFFIGSHDLFTWFRQVDIDPYGIIDLLGVARINGHLIIHLIELKAVAIDSNHFDQILRYKTGLERFIGKRFTGYKIVPTLVGLEPSSGHYIHNNLNVHLMSYTYGLGGVTFKSHGMTGTWYRTEDKMNRHSINKLWQRIAR